MSRAGSRGGPVPPMTLDRAQELLERWRADEMGWVRARILQVARLRGEVHADDLADLPLEQPNVIGAVINALCRGSREWGGPLITSTGERRRAAAEASHGRRSDVYRLTPVGVTVAYRLRMEVGDRLPGPRPKEEEMEPSQDALFAEPEPSRRNGAGAIYDPA